MPQFRLNHEYVLVSSQFIEEYMPKANAAFVTIYLYAINLAHKGEKVEYASIASALNLLESDVVQAFSYWKDEGVLRLEEDEVILGTLGRAVKSVPNAPKQSIPKEAANKETTTEPVKVRQTRPGYAPGEAAGAIHNNSTLSEMVMLAQEILGKTLNPTDTETLYWFYEGLKFSPEVILMLLEYCVSKEKRRMSYIEKVAVSWHERGITSMNAVNDHIQKESERTGYIYSIRKLFGITDRALSQSEEQFITRWQNMYMMEEDMVSHAYEQCIIQTAKLSFPYIEKILERWHKQGIHTVEQAEADSRSFKSSQPSPNDDDSGLYSDDYDHELLEKLTRTKYNR